MATHNSTHGRSRSSSVSVEGRHRRRELDSLAVSDAKWSRATTLTIPDEDEDEPKSLDDTPTSQQSDGAISDGPDGDEETEPTSIYTGGACRSCYDATAAARRVQDACSIPLKEQSYYQRLYSWQLSQLQQMCSKLRQYSPERRAAYLMTETQANEGLYLAYICLHLEDIELVRNHMGPSNAAANQNGLDMEALLVEAGEERIAAEQRAYFPDVMCGTWTFGQSKQERRDRLVGPRNEVDACVDEQMMDVEPEVFAEDSNQGPIARAASQLSLTGLKVKVKVQRKLGGKRRRRTS